VLFKLAISLILTFTSVSWADCPEDIQVVTKGQIVNCDGILLSPIASKKADEAIQDSKYYKALSDKLIERQDYTTKEMNILDKRLQLYVEQSQILSKELVYKENQDKWQKFVWFGLGVAVSGLAVYSASQLK
jgi:hypothetical protein